jgi:hypothetical protein
MRKSFKVMGWILLVLLIVIQFFRPEENIGPAFAGHRLQDAYKIPPEIDIILQASCNDCHSNNTRAMWYMNIQPVGWWIAHHVDEGKAELNFDEFGTYSLARQYHKFEEIEEMVNDGEMPLTSYTIMHDYAKLTEQDRKLLIGWSESMRAWMKETYPADSLVRK